MSRGYRRVPRSSTLISPASDVPLFWPVNGFSVRRDGSFSKPMRRSVTETPERELPC